MRTQTFSTSSQIKDDDLLDTLLTKSRTGRKSDLTKILDTTDKAVAFEGVANYKKLAAQIVAYNARHSDRHFAIRTHENVIYAVKVVKPAPRKV